MLYLDVNNEGDQMRAFWICVVQLKAKFVLQRDVVDVPTTTGHTSEASTKETGLKSSFTISKNINE